MINKVVGYRKMIGYTQKQMAKELSISEGQYRSKEKGNHEFSRSEMKIFKDIISKKIRISSIDEIFF